jgi:hypothetical protein
MALTTGIEGDLAETALISRLRVQVCLHPETCFQVRSLTLFLNRDMLHTYRRPGYDNHYDIPRQVEVYRCR